MGNRNSSLLQDEEIELIKEETGFSAAQIERLYARFKSLDKSGICGSLSRQDFLSVPELYLNPLCDRIVHMFFVDCDADHDRINFRQFMKVLAAFRSSSKPTRSRHASRQESIQTILSSLAQNRYRHSRHSSCDGFFNYYPVQHHTTNQHSIHYVASTTHLASAQHPFSYNNNNHGNNLMGLYNNQNSGSFKRPHRSLLDPDEPANSRKQKLFFMFKIYDVDDDDRISLEDLKEILKMMGGKFISEAQKENLAEKILRSADKNCNGYIDFDEFCTAFLHQDIDESLKVKFSTQANDASDHNGNKNNKAKPR